MPLAIVWSVVVGVIVAAAFVVTEAENNLSAPIKFIDGKKDKDDDSNKDDDVNKDDDGDEVKSSKVTGKIEIDFDIDLLTISHVVKTNTKTH